MGIMTLCCRPNGRTSTGFGVSDIYACEVEVVIFNIFALTNITNLAVTNADQPSRYGMGKVCKHRVIYHS